jgi:hypothetical protein
MKYRTWVLVFAFALNLFTAHSAWAQQSSESQNTVSISFLTATYQLDYLPVGSQPVLLVTFSTNDPEHHSVYCVNAYRDLKYVLRNAAGKVMPVNVDAWKTNVDRISGGGGYVPGAPNPCSTVKASVHQSRVLMRALYPDVPHGSYTLQVILAPRGGKTAEAAFAPISIRFK